MRLTSSAGRRTNVATKAWNDAEPDTRATRGGRARAFGSPAISPSSARATGPATGRCGCSARCKRFDFPGPDLSGQSAQQDGLGRRDLLREPRRPAGTARPRRRHRAGRRRHRHHRGGRQDCARSATVFSGGFGEGGDPKGRALGAQLKRAIEDAGLAVSGPNCIGNLAAPSRLMTIPDDRIAELERGPVAHRRPERRHRDGDPPGAARARRHHRLRGHQRQRNRALHMARLHPLSRRRSRHPRHRLFHRIDQARGRIPERLRICARRRQAGGRGQDRRLRGKPQGGARAHRLARGLARNASTRSPRRSAWCASIRSTRWWRRSSISPRGAAEGTAARRA